MQTEFITIIIPTYKDWRRLRLCLDALATQTYPQNRFEVIVVNNEPSDQPPAGYQLAPNCRIVDEAKPGSYAARNTGLRLAKGTIIGFTDSDCIPQPGWIANAVQYFQAHPECSRIAGQLQIIYANGKPTVAELYNSLYAFPQHIHVKNNGSSVTGNLFCHRRVFDDIGLFDEQLLSLGDLAWGKKAQAAGHAICYVADVCVLHPARNFRELVIKERRVGGGQALSTPANRKAMIRGFVFDNLPQRNIFAYVYTQGRSLNLFQKAQVVLLRHYLISVRAFERLRVQIGKQPNRA